MHLALAACVAALLPAPASACGACIEDKVAATYDHAVVTRAVERGRVMVFAEVKGAGAAEALTRAARKAAIGTRGIDSTSVRISQQPAGLSFALDARARKPVEALAAVQRAAGIAGLELALLKVLP